MSVGYFTLKEETENIIVIERSKFICNIKNILNEDDARRYVEEIRKRHSLANHHCYAYIADEKGMIQKFSDDGEPQGTAGHPILDVLKNKKIYKVVAVVTRYFGGVKLGTGGLVRAYSSSVSECLSKAYIANMITAVFCNISLEYELYSILLNFLSNLEVVIKDTLFDNKVTVTVAVKEDYYLDFERKLTDYFNGRVSSEKIYTDYFDFGVLCQ